MRFRIPSSVRSAVLGGLGIRLVEGVGLPDTIAEALEAPSLADVSDPTPTCFAPSPSRPNPTCARLPPACAVRARRSAAPKSAASRCRVLVAVGSADPIAGSPEELAALIPGARALAIPDRDHMLAVGDRAFKAAVLEFLTERP